MDDLQLLKARLSCRESPVSVFFRDDDAGWAMERLRALMRRFGECDVPLDLATIPGAIDDAMGFALSELLQKANGRVRVHQHGYTHTNHELSGRKCEFGSGRPAHAQRRDIEAGQERLQNTLGDFVDPLFTPPWNRCIAKTCHALAELRFAGLSRISGSDDLDHHGLRDISVDVDWEKSYEGKKLSRTDFVRYVANRFDDADVVGIMLHHEKMDDTDLNFFSTFLEALCNSSQVRFRSMMDVTKGAGRSAHDNQEFA